jgi:sensor histidine kinase YesM
MGFFSFLVLLAIAFLVWRISDQLPDLVFRISEIQRDLADIRRQLNQADDDSA